MNILGLCLSKGKGGLESYALQAIRAMHAADHRVYFVISPDGIGDGLELPFPVSYMSPASPKLPLLAALKLARYLDENQIDVIHIHWNKDLTLAALSKWLSKRKPKLVYSRHMEITRSKMDIYHKALYSQVDCMLANTKFVQEQAIRYLPMPRHKIKLLYLGVKGFSGTYESGDEKLISPDEIKIYDFIIGMIGRIEYGKGQHILVESVDILRNRGINSVILMAGPIMDSSYFDKTMKRVDDLGLTDNVKYLGVSREPQHLMRLCDVVVLTTFCETFGLVLAEAMRAGVAVIGSNAGGVPEIISDNETGMLYEPGNAEQLADKITTLKVNDEMRIELARAGKEFADLEFNEDVQFAKLAKFIEQL